MSQSARSRGLRAAVAGALAAGAAALALFGGGGTGTGTAAAVEGTWTVTIGSPTRPPKPVRRKVIVPDVVGLDHQLAQDTMQARGLWRLSEQDATGRGRLLLWDRNWTVVEQWPLPGARVSRDQNVVLSSVKDDELGLPGNPPEWPTVARSLRRP